MAEVLKHDGPDAEQDVIVAFLIGGGVLAICLRMSGSSIGTDSQK